MIPVNSDKNSRMPSVSVLSNVSDKQQKNTGWKPAEADGGQRAIRQASAPGEGSVGKAPAPGEGTLKRGEGEMGVEAHGRDPWQGRLSKKQEPAPWVSINRRSPWWALAI